MPSRLLDLDAAATTLDTTVEQVAAAAARGLLGAVLLRGRPHVLEDDVLRLRRGVR